MHPRKLMEKLLRFERSFAGSSPAGGMSPHRLKDKPLPCGGKDSWFESKWGHTLLKLMWKSRDFVSPRVQVRTLSGALYV